MLALSSITKVVTSKAFIIGASVVGGIVTIAAVSKIRKKVADNYAKQVAKVASQVSDEEINKIMETVEAQVKAEAEEPKKEVVKAEADGISIDITSKEFSDVVFAAIENVANMKDENTFDPDSQVKLQEAATKLSNKIQEVVSTNNDGSAKSATDVEVEPFNVIRFKEKRVK